MDVVDGSVNQHLLRRASTPSPDGVVVAVDAATAPWRYLELTAYRLARGGQIERSMGEREQLVLVLEGTAAVRIGGLDLGVIGSRCTVFEGPPPPVVLVGPGEPLEVVADRDALVVVASAPAGPLRRTSCTRPAEILVENRGNGSTQRRIHHLLPPSAEAGRLIAFEVFTPGGHWSSYPPHKHDVEDPPRESLLEEVYFYRFARPGGFALQRIYSADRELDECLAPGDCDLVLVPRGYHPVAAAAGYDCYYLNVMAGPSRDWRFTIDPDHSWLMDWDPAAPLTVAPEEARI